MIFKYFKYNLTRKVLGSVENTSSLNELIDFKTVINKSKTKTFLIISEKPAELKFLTPVLSESSSNTF